MSANVTTFGRSDSENEGPSKLVYKFELKGENGGEPTSAAATGFLSYGHAFVSVVEDPSHPLLMIPYDRILSITTSEPVIFGRAN